MAANCCRFDDCTGLLTTKYSESHIVEHLYMQD
jgi:hypothetical protein